MNYLRKKERGMGLIEVLIALAIFSLFSVTYLKIQGGAVLDSIHSREELKLKSLLSQVMNEIKCNPPIIDDLISLTIKPETKPFENNPEYEYTVEYKNFTIPNIEEEVDGSSNQIYEQVIEKMASILFQVKVSVNRKGETFSMNAATWIYLPNEGVGFEMLLQ